MAAPHSPFDDDLRHEPRDFSLVLGGPLFQLLRRVHISDDALDLVRRRTILISAFAWLPLLVLSLLEGNALGGNAAVPFLRDVDVHVRFLIVLPLLIVAELAVHQRMRSVVKQFLDRQLIPANASTQFDAAVEATFRLRNSVVAELLLVAFVYLVGISVIWRHYGSLTTATWYAAPADAGMTLTLSGWWYGYVSLPFFQFLLLRWYYRLFIWARFLRRISRIDLSLVPTHPDRVGGLGFLSHTAHAFLPLAVAHGAMLAGFIANRIFYADANLLDFKAEVGLIVCFVLSLVFGPLLMFAPQLAQAKRTGLREYGTFADHYVREFDAKWLRGGAPADEPLLGTADIQSLADLRNSLEVVEKMRVVPVTKEAAFQLAAATLLPVAPLALTMMSLEDLVKKLLGILL